MKKAVAIVKIGFRQMIADPMYMVFTFGLPIMMTWAMSFLPKEAGIFEMASLGVMVMFVALNLINSSATILEEKQKGTWQRILISPTSFVSVMSGYFARLFLVAWAQAFILLFSSKYFFGAPWQKGYGEMILVITVYIFAMTGLGLFLASLLKTQGQVQAVAMAFVMIGTMLGDVFFPIENPSGIIKLIAAVSPQSWAAHALKDVLTTGVSLASLALPLLWMTGFGLILFAAGIFGIKLEAR